MKAQNPVGLEELGFGSRDFWEPFPPLERGWDGMSSPFHDSTRNSCYPEVFPDKQKLFLDPGVSWEDAAGAASPFSGVF